MGGGVWLGALFFFPLFYPGPDSSLFACSPIGSSLGMSTFISLQALRIGCKAVYHLKLDLLLI